MRPDTKEIKMNKGEGKDEVRCENRSKTVRCTERKFLRRYQGTFDIFFEIEHRMRREEIEESMQGWRFAADAAMITDECAGSEDRKHTSGGVFVAIDSSLGAVIDKKKERSRPSQQMREESPKHG